MGSPCEDRSLIGMTKAASHFGDGEIIVGIFDGARSGALVGKGDIALGVVIEDAAAAFLLRIGWRHGCVLEHGLKRGRIIDAFQALHESIGDNDVGIAPTLSAAVVISASCVGHVAGMAIDIDERSN